MRRAASYEEEQRKLKESAPEPEAFISTETNRTANAEQLVARAKRILVHEFIEKIMVSEARHGAPQKGEDGAAIRPRRPSVE